MDWRIERVDSPEEFLRRTELFRDEHPMETNIIGLVATSVASGNKSYSAYFFWVVLAHNKIIGIASRTAPYRLLVSTMPEGSARQLAKAVSDIDPDCWGVTGPEEIAAEFIEAWCDRTGKVASDYPRHMRETTYVLDQHTPLAGVIGAARKADERDVALLSKWLSAFVEEVGISNREVPSEEDLLKRLRSTSIIIWQVDGRPVAMSGHSSIVVGPSGRIGRIGPVYTEPAERGNGFGAAVTSSMIEHLHSIGCSTVMLYADSDYEKSNRVYQGLGFRPVGAIVEFGLEPQADSQL